MTRQKMTNLMAVSCRMQGCRSAINRQPHPLRINYSIVCVKSLCQKKSISRSQGTATNRLISRIQWLTEQTVHPNSSVMPLHAICQVVPYPQPAGRRQHATPVAPSGQIVGLQRQAQCCLAHHLFGGANAGVALVCHAHAPRGPWRFCRSVRSSTTRSSYCPLGLAMSLVPTLNLPLTLAQALALALRRKIE